MTMRAGWVVWVLAFGCRTDGENGSTDGIDPQTSDTTAATGSPPNETGSSGLSGMTGLWSLTGCTGAPDPDPQAVADVEGVSMASAAGGYTVSVTVASADIDCDQYANWWEIVTPDGELVYRRILNHSHADEQPFTRASEGPVALDGAETYRVRAHLHPNGYGGDVMEGTPDGGFDLVDVSEGWADGLASEAPLPEACWY